MSKADLLAKHFEGQKKTKKQGKGVIASTCQFCKDVAQFVFFATAIAGGYVLATQGSINMKVVGMVVLSGGVIYFADKTIRK